MSQIELNINISDEDNQDTSVPNMEDVENQMEKRLSSLKRAKKVPFWSNDPNVLLQQKYITEFFPMDSMTFEQKLNAVSRTVIVLGLLSFAYSRKVQILGITALSLFLIFLMYFFINKRMRKE